MTPNQNQEQKNWFYFIGFVLSRNSWEETVYDLNTFKPVADPGERSGSFAPSSPPPRRDEKKFFETAPLPHPKVWIHHCKLWLKVSIYWETLNHSFLADKPIFFIWSIFSKTAKVNPPWFMRPRTFFFKVPKEKI